MLAAGILPTPEPFHGSLRGRFQRQGALLVHDAYAHASRKLGSELLESGDRVPARIRNDPGQQHGGHAVRSDDRSPEVVDLHVGGGETGPVPPDAILDRRWKWSGGHDVTLSGRAVMTGTGWVFPPAESADENGVVGIGADLEPETLLAAYSRGLFPMPIEQDGPIAWWSPDPRAVIPLDGFHVSRSLRRSMRRFDYSVNGAFDDVVRACANPDRPHGWIDEQIREAYGRLHRMGWAHSVEVRNPDGDLVGGVYGVGIGRFFAGESMFHTETDASKAALATLVTVLKQMGVVLFDVQWMTPHLERLGATDMARSDYLRALENAVVGHPDDNSRVSEDPSLSPRRDEPIDHL